MPKQLNSKTSKRKYFQLGIPKIIRKGIFSWLHVYSWIIQTSKQIRNLIEDIYIHIDDFEYIQFLPCNKTLKFVDRLIRILISVVS